MRGVKDRQILSSNGSGMAKCSPGLATALTQQRIRGQRRYCASTVHFVVDIGQGFEAILDVSAHGRFGADGVAGFDRLDDRAVIIDRGAQAVGVVEAFEQQAVDRHVEPLQHVADHRVARARNDQAVPFGVEPTEAFGRIAADAGL